MARLREASAALGVSVTAPDSSAGRRELHLLMSGDDADVLRARAQRLCADAFGAPPRLGVLTYLSRGTDDDAKGVLAGFGLTAEVSRAEGEDGVDVVTVRLPRAELDRVPESRVHTALEAALNCDVRIVAE
jgi:hypothetical protein